MTAGTWEKKSGPLLYGLIVVFTILTAGILAAGFLFYQGQERRYRNEAKRDLAAIAEMKVAQLQRWRRERLGNAEIIYNNATLSDLVLRYFRNPRDSEAEWRVREWIDEYPERLDYDQARLLDPRGVTRMSSPSGRPPASAAISQRLPEVLQSGNITIVDLYRHDHDQRIYLSVLVPILDRSADNRAVGVISLQVDPEEFLFPFILRWPASYPTAETLLVRHEGDEVLYLNELKFQKNTALNHRLPMTSTEKPAVLAVLGWTGIVEGMDYRNQPVIADVRAVPDSPWFLVTQINTSEVYAPAHAQFWMLIGFAAALIFAAGAGLSLVWRRRNLAFYREQYQAAEALQREKDKLEAYIETTAAIVLILNPDQTVALINNKGCEILGYGRDEILGKNWFDHFLAEEDKNRVKNVFNMMMAGKVEPVEYFENYVLTRNGEKRMIAWHNAILRDDAGAITGTLGTGGDITARMQAEDELKRSLKEKEVLLKEIHHRVKNNMQVVSSLLNLQAKGISDKEVRAKFEESRNRVRSMALVHEKLYGTKDLAHIDFNAYLQNLVKDIAGTYKRHDIIFSIAPESLDLDVTVGIPCGLIVNELVSNSLKYAFPDGRKGMVEVGIKKNRGNFVLTVADNGIGLPAKIDFRSTSSLGLQLVTMLTMQIHGTVELSRTKGTRFSITFPGTPAIKGTQNG